VLLLFFLTFLVFGQTRFDERNIFFEPFYDVSNALSKATGNRSTNDVISEPNAMGFRIFMKEKNLAIRLGTNFKYVLDKDLVDKRNTLENTLSLGFGLEKRRDLSSKIQFYYGGDFRYYYLRDRVTTFDQNGGFTIDDQSEGFGFAPILGIRWNINDRFALMTEGSFAFQLLNGKRITTNTDGNTTNQDLGGMYTLNPTLPGSILFVFRL
jgi:hypothetical protein